MNSQSLPFLTPSGNPNTATTMASGGPPTGVAAAKKHKPNTPEDESDLAAAAVTSAISAAVKHKPNNPQEESDLAAAVTSAVSGAHSFLLRHDELLSPQQSLSLESLLSSAAVSLRRLSLPLPLRQPLPSGGAWFHRLSPLSPIWAHSFGMSHPTFLRLLRLLALPGDDPAVLAAALLRLAHAAPYTSLARRFALPSPAAASRAFFAAVKALCDRSHHFLAAAAAGCPPSSSLPNCCGALGFARFGGGAISVQALVNLEGRFVDVSAGWPGSLKPESILHQTRLYLGVEESREFLNGHCFDLGELIPQYVLGDSCFPLLPWLLTPYRAPPAGSPEAQFNTKHEEAMRVARAALRRVRRRWRILERPWKEDCVEFLPFVVVACCLLQNFVENSGEGVVDVAEDEDEEEEEGFGISEGDVNESGERVRDAVAVHLNRVYA